MIRSVWTMKLNFGPQYSEGNGDGHKSMHKTASKNDGYFLALLQLMWKCYFSMTWTSIWVAKSQNW